MWSRTILTILLVGMCMSEHGTAVSDESDSLMSCEDAVIVTPGNLTNKWGPRFSRTSSPNFMVVWCADPALPDSALPSFANAIEDTLIAYFKTMSNGYVTPTLTRARRPGGASSYAFVADSAFANYKSAGGDFAGRVGLMNLKFIKQLCAAGIDFSGVDAFIFVYNSNPYKGGLQFGEGALFVPEYGTVDSTEALCNGKTVGWFMQTGGAGVRYLWSRGDARNALAFGVGHETGHLFAMLHQPGSESSTGQRLCPDGVAYSYGHYGIMRGTVPFDDLNMSHCLGDWFPIAVPDLKPWVTETPTLFDDAGRVLGDVRRGGPFIAVSLDSANDERLQIVEVSNRRFDRIKYGYGLEIWRVQEYDSKGPPGWPYPYVDPLNCPLWDIESAVGRFASGSPNPVAGYDSLDLYYAPGVAAADEEYLGSGNDVFSGASGRREMTAATNPSTKGMVSATRTANRSDYSNVAIKNIVAIDSTQVRADIFVGYDTLTVTSAVDSTNDATPAMSPDGTKVAWVRGTGTGRDIYVESLENHSDRHRMGFTNGSDVQPSWDPFSGRIAFVSDSLGISQVFTGQYNGLGVTQITSSEYPATYPQWSTKGDSIVYLEEADEYGETRIMKISAFGGTARPLTRTPDPDYFTFEYGLSWSPDAAKLSFLRNDSLFTMDAVGGNETLIVTGANRRGLTSWSPDGDWIAYEDANSQLRRVRISNPSENTRWTVSGRGRFTEPNYQPWGTRIGVTHKGTPTDDIWTYRFVEDEAPVLDSVGTRTVAPGVTLTINLSSTDPDGDYVAYDGFFLPSGASFSGNSFSWTPSGGQVGVYKVKFRVVDLVSSGGAHKGGSDHEWVTINVSGGGGGCPFVDTKSADGWVIENSILSRSLDNELVNDLLQLKFDPQRVQNTYSVRIRENENEETTLDQASLVGVDHSADLRVFRRRGEYELGIQMPAYRVTNAEGQDVTQLVDGSQAEPFVGQPGETLTVELVAPALRRTIGLSSSGQRLHDEEEDPPVLNSGGKDLPPEELRRSTIATQSARTHDAMVLEGTGIILQVPGEGGSWKDVERMYPRADYGESVPDSVNSSTFRMVFVGQHQIRFIGRLVRSEAEPSIVTAELASASHSRLGDVHDALVSSGSGSTDLAPGDTLNLDFMADAPSGENVRTWFLATRGVYSTLESQMAGGGRGQSLAVVPLVYSLALARPNPSTGRVSMQYSLAKPGRTSLRIYSGSGRLVRTLVDGDQQAGNYEAVWDGKSSRGASLGAGVYFYRLSSGNWKSERKVTLLP